MSQLIFEMAHFNTEFYLHPKMQYNHPVYFTNLMSKLLGNKL